MRRTSILLFALLTLTATASAQIGKRVTIRAGTAEDRAVREITAATDAAQKLALLEKFLADYGQGEMALVAYDIYIDHYLAAKDFDKVYDYGEKSLALDPDAYSVAMRMFTAAQQQGDAARLFDYGSRIGAILERYKARPAPEGVDGATWQSTKAGTLEENRDGTNYVEYTLFSTAYNNPDPAAKTVQLEQFVAAFPDSQYAANAQNVVAYTYQQTKQFDKMEAFIEKVLAARPDNVTMLLMAADSWNERRVELDKAEAYAARALKALETAQRPATLTDEQWAQQKPIQQGLAHSITGQIQIQKNRNTQAVVSLNAAAPLLKSDPVAYSRNQYWLGFALINLKRLPEARAAFTEAAAADTPFRGPSQEKLKTLPAPRPAKRRP
jgi:tetratricopeptide (TPR) repeat protein